MIASQRGLVLLGALVIALGLAWSIEPRPAPVPSRALWLGFDEAEVTALRWTRPVAGVEPRPEVVLRRDAAGWAWVAPAGRAEAAVVAAVLDALRGGRWHRRGEVAAAGAPTVVLEVTTRAEVRTFAIGAPLPGAEQTWLVVRGAGEAGDATGALLVDGWVARALAPAPGALRRQRPLAAAATARAIELHGRSGGRDGAGGEVIDAVLDGAPRRLLGASPLRLAPGAVAALEDALAALTIIALPAPSSGPPAAAAIGDHGGLQIRLVGVDGGELTEAGACAGHAGLVAVTGPLGDGCVDGAAWDAVLAAARALGGPSATAVSLADPRPLAATIATLDLGALGVLELSGAPRLRPAGEGAADVAADPAAVDALRVALAAPAVVIPRPTGAPRASWRARDRDGGEVALERLGPALLARAGEPVALRLAPAAAARLDGALAALVDRTLWREDPLTLTALSVDGRDLARGAVIGEWTAPAAAWPRLDALALALAAPTRTPASPPATFAIAHRLTVTFTPPSGPPQRHTLELAGPTASGCAARVDGVPMVLPPPLCAAIVAR